MKIIVGGIIIILLIFMTLFIIGVGILRHEERFVDGVDVELKQDIADFIKHQKTKKNQ